MSADPYPELKDRMRQGWTESEYTELGRRLLPAARELVDACAISAGQEVLDVACGDGNLAILAALEGASVTGSDLAPGQLERAAARAKEEGVDIEWVEGDAEDLPFDEQSFDCAASVFGAFIAPRPERAASELFRVVRPGGTVGMANWAADGFQAKFFDVMGKYGPPRPEGVPRQALWGDEDVIRERFDGLASSIDIQRRSLPWEFESMEEMGEFFGRTGPQTRNQADMPEERLQAMVQDLLALVAEHNEADDGSVHIEAPYVLVVARKPG
jgi:SAM-dependent methyltransferase